MSEPVPPYVNLPLISSDGTPSINKALATAQGAFLPIKKSKTVYVSGKDGKSGYTFNYADLNDIIAATAQALAANGIAVSMPIETNGNQARLNVQLRHSSGEMLSTTLPFNIPPGPQQLGSLLSYYRRYLLSSLINVASEEDDDGNAASGNAASGNAATIEERNSRKGERKGSSEKAGKNASEPSQKAPSEKPPATGTQKDETQEIRGWVYPFDLPAGMRGIALGELTPADITKAGMHLSELKAAAQKANEPWPDDSEKLLCGLRKLLANVK